MPVVVLIGDSTCRRTCTSEQWLAERATPIVHPTRLDSGNLRAEGGGRTMIDLELFVTSEEDLARAYIGALEAVQIGHARFDAVLIAGDEDELEHNLSKARRLLGWTPTHYTPASSAE